MIPQASNNRHWNYLLALDADAEQLARFVEFTPDNYDTYSIELARLLMSAASEVDVVAKMACSLVAPQGRVRDINDYRRILHGSYPSISSYPVEVKRYGLTMTPWDNWSKGRNPIWWGAYNKVKHERHNHFREANLKNALNALAGLFIVLIYAFPAEARSGELLPPSLLSIPDGWHDGWTSMGLHMGMNYRV